MSPLLPLSPLLTVCWNASCTKFFALSALCNLRDFDFFQGNAIKDWRCSCHIAVHPRACGERGPTHYRQDVFAGSSPRVRGTRKVDKWLQILAPIDLMIQNGRCPRACRQSRPACWTITDALQLFVLAVLEKHRPTAAERFGARQAGGGEVSGDGWLIGPAPRQGYAGAIAPLAPAGHRARCFILIHHSPRHKMRRLAAGPRRSPPLMPHRRENRPRYRRPRAATRRKPPRRSSACGAYGARSCGRRRPQSCRR